MKRYGFGFLSDSGVNSYYCGERMVHPMTPFGASAALLPNCMSANIGDAIFEFSTYHEADNAANRFMKFSQLDPLSVLIIEKDLDTGYVKQYKPTIFEF